MCARRASFGSTLSSSTGSRPVWVDVMMSPFGIFTRSPGFAVLMASVVSCGVLKWAVAPLSNTKVGGADDKSKFDLLVLLKVLTSSSL